MNGYGFFILPFWRDAMRTTCERIILCLMLLPGLCFGKVFLPGTQPEDTELSFKEIKTCKTCHSKTKNGDDDPFFSWQGGMMAQAARDPLYRAALTVANQDVEGVGEFCWRCHTPRGWLEGRSSPVDGSQLNEEDMQGVSCVVCHRFVDPLSDEAKGLVKDVPPSYGNSMMVADPEHVMRGPYGDGKVEAVHKTMKSDFHGSSNLCGVCHNVSNPLQAKEITTEPVHSFGHVERTFSEWSLSAYPAMGKDGTCQSCHYKPVDGGGKPARFSKVKRDHFVPHGPVGGSTWIQDATWYAWNGKGMDKKAFAAAKKKAETLMRTAAKLELAFAGDNKANLKITNLTGHKLPTGYPEGRRMWVNAVYYDAAGEVLREDGEYGEKDDTVFGKAVKAPTLLDPESTIVYESKPAISEAAAKKHGLPAGPSFHFVLNDYIAKDNRIPPKGFNNATFKEHMCEPIGREYADGQHWDNVELTVPVGCVKIVVKLTYQSASWEYIKFLAEENKTDEWGKKLYEAWDNTGKCEPFVIAEVEAVK